jgi:hypothetical protein
MNARETRIHAAVTYRLSAISTLDGPALRAGLSVYVRAITKTQQSPAAYAAGHSQLLMADSGTSDSR